MTNITLPRSVVEQAIEALDYHTKQTRPIFNTELVIEVLRAALAAPPAKCPHSLFDVCCESPDDCSLGAAPQGEPVAVPKGWKNIIPGRLRTDEWDSARVGDYNNGWNDCQRKVVLALEAAATPQPAPTLEPLTDEQIEAIGRKFLDKGYPWEGLQPWVFSFARAVEAAHAAKLKGGA